MRGFTRFNGEDPLVGFLTLKEVVLGCPRKNSFPGVHVIISKLRQGRSENQLLALKSVRPSFAHISKY